MSTGDVGLTSLSQEIQDIALLLTQRGHGSQDAFDEDASGFTLGAKAASTPDDTSAQGPFGGIVGGFDACLSNKRPQSRFQAEEVVTHRFPYDCS